MSNKLNNNALITPGPASLRRVRPLQALCRLRDSVGMPSSNTRKTVQNGRASKCAPFLTPSPTVLVPALHPSIVLIFIVSETQAQTPTFCHLLSDIRHITSLSINTVLVYKMEIS